ncbi:MAG TPA: hypothetical protein VLF65_01260 [Burkholderiales bacterium]|jgi:hypothetical protein|nr:hypothetical protein [Burkholderiales bacterium]
MKPGLVTLAVLVIAWLAAWIFDIGVLVYSADTMIPKTRECRYFIGVSVLKRIEPLADRCPLIRGIGN